MMGKIVFFEENLKLMKWFKMKCYEKGYIMCSFV